MIGMNRALYWAMVKHDGKKIMACSWGIVLYEWLITGVYPVLVQSPEIEKIPQSFPAKVKRAFGVATGEKVDLSYEAYISAQWFGRFWSLIISVYAITTANGLVPQLLEQGFMAYPLASPVSRSEILNTQIAVLLTELAIITGVALDGIYDATDHYEIKIARGQYVRLGILAFSLSAVIGLYSILLAVLLPNGEEAGRYAAALTFAFYGLDVVSSLSDRFSGLRHLSLFGLFRPQDVLQGKASIKKKVAAFSLLTGGTWILARTLFARKDLSL